MSKKSVSQISLFIDGDKFNLTGTSFIEEFDSIIENLSVDDEVFLVHDKGNQYDDFATKVVTSDDTFIGWVPRGLNESYIESVQEGNVWTAYIDAIFYREENLNPGIRIEVVLDDSEAVRTVETSHMDAEIYEKDYGDNAAISSLVRNGYVLEGDREVIESLFDSIRASFGYPSSNDSKDPVSPERIHNCIQYLSHYDVDLFWLCELMEHVSGRAKTPHGDFDTFEKFFEHYELAFPQFIDISDCGGGVISVSILPQFDSMERIPWKGNDYTVTLAGKVINSIISYAASLYYPSVRIEYI